VGYAFATTEFLLAVTSIVFAAAWYRHPECNYEKLLAISVAVLAFVELVRRKLRDEPQQERDRKERKSNEDKVAKALSELAKAQQKPAPIPQSAPAPQPAGQFPPEDLETKQFRTILDFRDEIDARLKEYAKLHLVDVTDRSGQQLLDLVPIDKAFSDGIRNYLDTTEDLVHLSEPVAKWAATSGTTFVGVLDMLIKNAKTPAP